MDLVKIAEEAFACGKEHPEFRSGDTVTVSYRIKELRCGHLYRYMKEIALLRFDSLQNICRLPPIHP